ncbi:NAD-dependent epimerase/dehydratase family protein [Oricola cellulosilytica]|uniref:NAD(P)-dependent oxidoreductase n=1 Tax=Oricola cellulosilytica TaxID=1429082 RepID=A0A4R0PFS9_9HYPH|nr:NAD(P)-dependent oxidoreductase [Oricola cellulosilytica]TCD15948.1 NAD(P)-dependent oxidoreductase [Oricola cellulosilytica]
MKTALVSGGTGFAGRFIVEALLAAGYAVTVTGRTSPETGFFSQPVRWIEAGLEPDLLPAGMFDGVDAFVHAAFHHVAGKYRGGEGADPEAFRRLNVGGSVAMFAAATASGVQRAVFLSSRAVYGTQPPGAVLKEDTTTRPDTLYGQVKCEVELALQELSNFASLPVSLRVTGVYGPAGQGRFHKWRDLFDDYLAESPIAPRAATEVHGEDMAAAVRLMLEADPDDIRAASPGLVFNVSDILLDRRDLLGEYARLTGCKGPLPGHAEAPGFNAMDCTRLRGLGWRPRGHLDLTGLV